MSSWNFWEHPGDDQFGGLDLSRLGVDQAYLVAASDVDSWLFAKSDDCSQCSFQLWSRIEAKSNWSRIVDTGSRYTLRFQSRNESHDETSFQCQLVASTDQFGVYEASAEKYAPPGANTTIRCHFSTLKEPVNIYLSLLVCLSLLVTMLAAWKCVSCFRLRCRSAKVKGGGGGEEEPRIGAKKRLKSLDVFRGITIVLMMFVNDGGGHYWFFQHATWNGLLVADVVFPWFMWIMGVCIPMSLRSSNRRREPKLTTFLGIVRRSCILFLYGLVNNSIGGANELAQLRIPGVLQRFAVCYLVVSTIGLFCQPADLSAPVASGKWRRMLQDVLVLWPQWLVMAVILAAHGFITFFLPVPNCPTGYLGPAGLHMNSAYPAECIGGAAGYIDRWLLSLDHIYKYPTARTVYQSGPFDPEGILGSMTSVFQVFLGVQAGTTLLVFSGWKQRVARWLSWAVLTGTVAGVLCNFSRDDGWIPINKSLWSLSFVLATSALAFALLSLCLCLVDVAQVWNGFPFLHPGMNSMVMYLGHQIGYLLWPWHWRIGSMNNHLVLVFENLWGVACWVLVAGHLYHKKIFYTV